MSVAWRRINCSIEGGHDAKSVYLLAAVLCTMLTVVVPGPDKRTNAQAKVDGKSKAKKRKLAIKSGVVNQSNVALKVSHRRVELSRQ